MSARPLPTLRDGSSRFSLRMRRTQRAYAALVAIVPAVAFAIALVDVARGHAHAWQFVLLVTGYVVTMLGITVGYHRLLAHRAFKASPAVRAAFALAGSMAAQGPPLYWVSTHRLHHQKSDRPGDPHSPHVRGGEQLRGVAGLWHAHVQWTFDHPRANPISLAPDLLREPWLLWVNARYIYWVIAGLLLPALVGAVVTGSARGAWDGLLWGGLVRLFLSFQMTWSVNSITHLLGYRSFRTRDQSRNNLWLAIPTLGEAWHNNHHAFPSSAWLGLRAWEIDIGAWLIRLLAWCGLAQGVVRPTEAAIRRLHVSGAQASASDGAAAADEPDLEDDLLERSMGE